MSFIYSQALVEAFSGASCSDTDASAPLSGSLTPRPCLWHDKTMEPSRLSRFGMTCKPLTDDRGAELLTWWRAGFLARTSVLPEKAQESPGNDPGCGPTWRGSLAKYDPDSCSWRTVQLSLLGDSELSSVIWPRSGMTAGGQCWELPMLVRRTSGTGFGFWQTPVADDSVNRAKGKINSRGEPKLSAQVMKWPTPVSSDTGDRKAKYAQGGTPLSMAVRTWTTPTSHNAKETNAPSESERNMPTLAPQVGGSLNPTWVEWLMGWPIGHTDLKPSETARCLSAQPQHGECLEVPEC